MLTEFVVSVTFAVLVSARTTGIGVHQKGEKILHSEYLQVESAERRDLTLAFFFDGGSMVKNISYVAIDSESDTSFFITVLYDGGAGHGTNFINFTLTAENATYYRATSNFYGFDYE